MKKKYIDPEMDVIICALPEIITSSPFVQERDDDDIDETDPNRFV